MIKEELRINQRVEILLQNSAYDSNYAGSYPSRVEEILSDKIFFAAPIKKGIPIPLRKGDPITVNYWGQTAGYSFTTKVIETRFKRVLPVIIVERPKKVTRIQRRNFLRIPAVLPLTFSILEGPERVSRPEIFHTETVDLSGGGAMIKTPVKLSKDEYLEMELTLPRKGTINIVGRVVRTQETKKGSTGLIYLTGIDFEVIDESDRDKIIAFVFERQRELRRKGLM
ncbi:MAG: PilZ domain-containing protein [Bacillota bacterium]|nr:PilZ domain-containing protein [Bacillota bacterium]